ncbi:hypothetical protein KQH49_04985 [Mycetohabitans sp. B5]|uniref:Uncharacterized protein n=1 Tax=Mycetohabitans endofungorum TaxID=417203 RepID=A0A2P5KBN8_9BURK|nr:MULTISPECIES: hypothetical protein [Mycetohabitans]MCG1054350.1 hypothetical protein [Mycetohabitans sp. B5]PPB84055.1 hypothetical protein B0O95_1042 [Mycetohabitans endofungorum]
MKIISQVNWAYTLFEDEDGSYVLSIVVPARDAAWAVYEKEIRLSSYEKYLLKLFPQRVSRLVERFMQEKKRIQSAKSEL